MGFTFTLFTNTLGEKMTETVSRVTVALTFYSLISVIGLLLFIDYDKKKPAVEYVHRISEWVITENSAEAHFVGKKPEDRAPCERVINSEKAFFYVGKVKHDAVLVYVNDKTPNSSFGSGSFDMRTVRFVGEGINKATVIGWTMKHNCQGIEQENTFQFEY